MQLTTEKLNTNDETDRMATFPIIVKIVESIKKILEEDKKQNKYNVLKFTCETKEDVKNKIKPQLYFCINESAKAFELLDIKKYKHILGNIIYLGLEETFKKELNI